MNTQILKRYGLEIIHLKGDGEYITNGRKFVPVPRAP